MPKAKTIPIRPVTGYLDLRSLPEDVPVGGYRYVQNWAVEQKNKLCRMPGWTRLLDRPDYNNFDLHDQLQSLTGLTGRRPVTFTFEATSITKAKMLLAGTDRALYGLSIGTGNWRVLSDSIGVDGATRWYATQNEDTVILTNDNDPVVYWTFDAPPDVATQQSVAPVQDLIDLGITRVGVVITWNGCTFYMNIVENGTAKTNKILYSNYKKPLSLIPGDDSVAGSMEVDSQESILKAAPIGNVLLVYTTRAIWEVSLLNSTDQTFQIVRRYNPDGSESCLAFKNTLVNTGKEHLYMGREGIYSYNLFVPEPTLVEWINRASSVIYDELDRARCDWQIGAYDPARRWVWYSWVKEGETVPSRTLILNTQFPFSSIIDHGFTAFCEFNANEPFTSLGKWLLDTCICTSAEYEEEFGDPVKEGGPCVEQDEVTCDSQPDSLFTTVEKELEDGIVMEDWDEEESSPNSICSLLDADGTLSEMCVDESKRDECNAGQLFVMASAFDFCLKNFSDVLYRDVCLTFTGCGTYALVGYKSILRSGPINFKDYSSEKLVTDFSINAIAMEAQVPGQASFRIGVSSMPVDPNDDCGIKWYAEDPKSLDCVAVATATHDADATRPDNALCWPCNAIGKYLFFEITIENPHSTPIDTGAAVCFSGYTMDITPVGSHY